jgi:hypothetical protein
MQYDLSPATAAKVTDEVRYEALQNGVDSARFYAAVSLLWPHCLSLAWPSVWVSFHMPIS